MKMAFRFRSVIRPRIVSWGSSVEILFINLASRREATAEVCNFRYEDEEYAERMAAVGVEVTVKRFLGARHGFIPHFAEHWREATDLIVRSIRSASL